MSLRIKSGIASLFALIVLAVIGAAPASATTFCVPDFHAACPDNGTNVKQPNLQTAMVTLGSDGIADTIRIDEHAATDINSFTTSGTDDLTIIGSGTDKTTMTSTDNGNTVVVNLGLSIRKTSMSNLTIVVPQSFNDNQGFAISTLKGTFDGVDIKSLNPGSAGISASGPVTWKNSRIFGASGGSLGTGINSGASSSNGNLQILGTMIEDSKTAIVADEPTTPVTVKQSGIIQPTEFGVRLTNGGLLTMENTIVNTGGLEGISVETDDDANDSDIDVSVKNSTFVAGPDTTAAAFGIEIENAVGSNNADVTVEDSIVRGFGNTWNMQVPAGPGIGKGKLTLTDSNFPPVGLPDAVTVDLDDAGNINLDPQFVSGSDFRLQKGSPSIDAGSTAPGLLVDFAGAVRPQDGDGNGSAVRDQGAFEAPKLASCANTPSLCPKPPTGDKVAPKISRVKVNAPGRKNGSLKLTFSETAKYTATFKPTPKGKGKTKRKTVTLKKSGKAGANTVVLKKSKFKKGKYKLTVVATDGAGNKSSKVTRTVKVK